MATIPKLLFHNQGEFLKALRAMRMSGGPKQQAAEQVSQITGDFQLMGSTLKKLTNHGESRIPHCVKYDLRGDCRLVTVQNDGIVWLLYVGDHDDVDAWIQEHPGLVVVAGAKKQVRQTVVSDPGTTHLPSPSIVATTDTRPLLQRILLPEFAQIVPQAKLRRDLLDVTEETDEDTITEIVECLPSPDVQSLLIDLLYHLRKGQIDEALTRVDIYFGRASDVVETSGVLQATLASGENTELITDLTSLSTAERERLFSDDFEPWLLWLHPDQKKAVEEDFDRPAILKGVSGSGKTVILIHRARRLARKYPNETIGILTLNRSLARLLKNLIGKLCLEGEEHRIQVDAYYDYFQEILAHIGAEDYLKEYIRDLSSDDPMVIALGQALKRHRDLAHEFSPQSGETLDDTWDEFWRLSEDEFTRTKQAVVEAIVGRGEYDVKAYLRDEFTLIRSAFSRAQRGNSAGGQSYFEYRRAGRAIPISEKPRTNILRMLRRYEEYMFAGGLMDELALSQALLPARAKLLDLPHGLRRRCLLIDEFQDFSTIELSLLKQIPSSQENGLFLAGDMVQKVMVKDFNLPVALLDRSYALTRTITKNYRNSRQILQAAHALITHYGAIASKQDQSIEILNPELATRETAPPIAVKASVPIDAAWSIARQWVQDGGRQAWSVCIVSANPGMITPADILKARPADLEAERLTGDYILNREKMVVGTLSEVKGFEFSLIVVVGCEVGQLPDTAIPREETWRDALRLYVAMTRGRDQVVLLYHDRPSEFLEAMRDRLVWNENSFVFSGSRAGGGDSSGGSVQSPAVTARLKELAVSIPDPYAARNVLNLSNRASYQLLTYFEREVYPRLPKRPKHSSPRHLRTEFNHWLRPININRASVSAIFANTEFKLDVAQEIDAQLKRFGCALHWDRR